MLSKSVIFGFILIAAIALLTSNLSKLIAKIKMGQPEDRSDNPAQRIKLMLKVALAQTKIFRESFAGILHVIIFWGFLVLLFSASESVLQGFLPNFNWRFLGPFYTLITLSTDLFCAGIVITVLISLFRRFVINVNRLQGDASEKIDAIIVLGSIFIIVTSLLLQNATGHKFYSHEPWAFKPIAAYIGAFISFSDAPMIYTICWWIHIIMILVFANYLPFSKHLHVYTSIINVYYSTLGPVNKLQPINFEEEGIEKFGIIDAEDCSWKSILDSYSCTHCGRCTASCPANLTGKVLSPREIIVQLRERSDEKFNILIKKEQKKLPLEKLSENNRVILDKKFIGDYENIEAIWQCTTCGACMQECPINIEHVPVIVGMRRSLVMMESNFPQEIQPAMASLENNATPWAFSSAERADWAAGLDIKTAAENPDFDVLFWVGCAGSFDDRAKKISVAFAKLMQAAGVNFAILGTEEQCNGDVARRMGNEYLADMLIKSNIETMSRYNVKKIVTFCPHCFNTLKNEYPDFGGNFEVFHHTEFLNQMIQDGKLKIKPNGSVQKHIVYHDSCYMGRYNNVYEAPRELLHSIPGAKITEPHRHADHGLCCGAGGGRMFMEETVGKRVNIERTEELLATGADTIALNCPFCMTMITDGVKAEDKTESVSVKDISEILLEYIERLKD
jgi:Fe-S oxidoreductase